MRAVTAEELRFIAGGLKRFHANTEPPVSVTATVTNPSSPGSGGGGGVHHPAPPVGGGGGGGGGGGITIESAQIVALAKGIGSEIATFILEGDDPVGLVSTTVDWANLSASALNANLVSGQESWEMYQETGSSPNPGLSYVNAPINWNMVDWGQFASGATSYQQALQMMKTYYSTPHAH